MAGELAVFVAPLLWRKAPRFVIARPQRGRGNLMQAVAISPMASLLSGRVLRDCHVASLLAMTRQESARCTSAFLPLNAPPTGRSLTAATFSSRPAGCAGIAAADATGLFILIDALCKLQTRSRAIPILFPRPVFPVAFSAFFRHNIGIYYNEKGGGFQWSF